MAVGLEHQTADRAQGKKSLRVAALIRCGQLCRECRGDECRSIGRGNRIECPTCHGRGCELCDNGHITTTECLQKIAAPVSDAMMMIDLAEKGHLPVAGGVLDQSQWFMEAYRFYQTDVQTIKAEA